MSLFVDSTGNKVSASFALIPFIATDSCILTETFVRSAGWGGNLAPKNFSKIVHATCSCRPIWSASRGNSMPVIVF